MLISDLCQLSQVTKDTVRFYHRIGLLMPAMVNPYNRYGMYDERHCERLRYIKKLKSFGFSLKEIKSAILLEENRSLSDELRIRTLEKKLDDVDQKLKDLSDYKASLLIAIGHLKNRLTSDCDGQPTR